MSLGPQVTKILKYNSEHETVYCEMKSTLAYPSSHTSSFTSELRALWLGHHNSFQLYSTMSTPVPLLYISSLKLPCHACQKLDTLWPSMKSSDGFLWKADKIIKLCTWKTEVFESLSIKSLSKTCLVSDFTDIRIITLLNRKIIELFPVTYC